MKTIEKSFTFNARLGIEARNYNSHLLNARFAGGRVSVPLTKKEMRELADFLKKTADEIEADNDFGSQK